MFTLHHRNQLKQQQHQINNKEKHQCFTTVLDLQTLLYSQTSICYKVQGHGRVEIILVIFGSKVFPMGTVDINRSQFQFILKDKVTRFVFTVNVGNYICNAWEKIHFLQNKFKRAEGEFQNSEYSSKMSRQKEREGSSKMPFSGHITLTSTNTKHITQQLPHQHQNFSPFTSYKKNSWYKNFVGASDQHQYESIVSQKVLIRFSGEA